jgi:hypothetical protein
MISRDLILNQKNIQITPNINPLGLSVSLRIYINQDFRLNWFLDLINCEIGKIRFNFEGYHAIKSAGFKLGKAPLEGTV